MLRQLVLVPICGVVEKSFSEYYKSEQNQHLFKRTANGPRREIRHFSSGGASWLARARPEVRK
jgi:hypothetical protein